MGLGLSSSPASVLSQKFVDEVSADLSGRENVAHGANRMSVDLSSLGWRSTSKKRRRIETESQTAASE
jgi:hypothetical protein